MTELYRSDPEKYNIFQNTTSKYIEKLNKACDEIQIDVSNMPTCINRLVIQKCGCDDDCVYDFYKNIDFDKKCKKWKGVFDSYVHCPKNFDDVYDIEEDISNEIDYRGSIKIQNIIRNRLFTAVQKYNAICEPTSSFFDQKRKIECSKKLIKSYCKDDRKCIDKIIRDYNIDTDCPKESNFDTHEGLVIDGVENKPKSIFDYIEFEDNRNNEVLMRLPDQKENFRSSDTIDFNDYNWDNEEYSSNIFKNDKFSIDLDFNELENDSIQNDLTSEKVICNVKSNISIAVIQIVLVLCTILGFKIYKSKFGGWKFLSLMMCYIAGISILILNEILHFY